MIVAHDVNPDSSMALLSLQVPENVKFCVPEEVLTSGNESLCSLDVSENGCDKTTRPSPVAIVRKRRFHAIFAVVWCKSTHAWVI